MNKETLLVEGVDMEDINVLEEDLLPAAADAVSLCTGCDCSC